MNCPYGIPTYLSIKLRLVKHKMNDKALQKKDHLLAQVQAQQVNFLLEENYFHKIYIMYRPNKSINLHNFNNNLLFLQAKSSFQELID